jgi:flagellum-specific peptidoglycan hydrolase FlgJ
MFRVFEEVSESFREHSLLLNSPRYKGLKKLEPTDYKGWARGLKKAGYATDPRYAEKLIRIIEALDLDQYDIKA